MHRLFLDANILFSAAYSAEAGIQRLWRLPSVKLVTSQYAIEETKRNLKHLEQNQRLEKFLKQLEFIGAEHSEEVLPYNIQLATKDRPILSAAIYYKATHLITGDYRDFGRYFGQIIAGVTILPPAEYLLSIASKPD